MSEVIDSLITRLEYDADTKVIAEADKKLKSLEKQSEETAKATDDLTDQQVKLKSSLQDTSEAAQKLKARERELTAQGRKLKKEEREIAAAVKKAGKATREQTQALEQNRKSSNRQQKELRETQREFKQTSAQAQKFSNSLKRLGIQQAKLNRQRRSTGGQQRRLGAAAGAAKESAGSFGGLGGLVGPKAVAGLGAAAAPAAAIFAAAAAGAAGYAAALRTVVETGARMESLRARLKTVEGGTEQAAEAFDLLRRFSTETPFELEDVTNAYVRLKSLGLQPTEAQLKSFGNVAAAQGKPIIDFIEAVGDASTGEFERLKEFGIKASSQGEQVAFTFAGVTTKVKKNASDISAFLEGLGQNQFAGAMEDQMNTFNGVLSNLKDTWTSFLDQVAQLGVLDEAKALISDLSGTMGDGLAQTIADVLIAGLQLLRNVLAEVQGDGEGVGDMVKSLVELVKLAARGAMFFAETLGGDTATQLLKLIGLLGKVAEMINNLLDGFSVLTENIAAATGDWELFGSSVDSANESQAGFLSTVMDTTAALGKQGDEIKKISAAFDEARKKAMGPGTLSDAELQEARRGGGAGAKAAEGEISKRTKDREKAERDQDSADRKKARQDKKVARSGDVAKDFSKLNDRQLSSFATDPNVSKKLRDKAEKEQTSRDKKKRKKGAAAGKKAHGATLAASIQKQITKTARELAQADAARALRAGKIKPGELAGFETERFEKRQQKMQSRFDSTGQLPAGIAQDVRQISALPSVNDLAGRTAAPVISVTNNRFDVSGNTFTAEVTGAFAQSPRDVASQSLPEFRRMLFTVFGEAVPSVGTQELR